MILDAKCIEILLYQENRICTNFYQVEKLLVFKFFYTKNINIKRI